MLELLIPASSLPYDPVPSAGRRILRFCSYDCVVLVSALFIQIRNFQSKGSITFRAKGVSDFIYPEYIRPSVTLNISGYKRV